MFTFPVHREPLDECSIGKDECEMILMVWPIISAAIWLLIYLPIVLYHGKKYYSHSHHIVYTNRYADIVTLQIKTFIVQLLFSLNNIFAVWYVDQVQPLYIIYLSIETSVSIYLYYLFVWRFYLLYYDINFVTESKNNQWIAVINPVLFKRKIISPQTETKVFDFFLSHRNSLGNKKYLYNNILFPACILSAVIFTFSQLSVSFLYQDAAGIYGNDAAFAKSYSISLTLKVIPFIILSVIYYKMPQFEDDFYVTVELQRLFLCLLMCIICIYGATLMQIWTQENLLWNAIIGPCITYNTILFWHTLIMYVSTGWVNKTVQKILNSQRFVVKNVQLPTGNDDGYNVQFLEYDNTHNEDSDYSDDERENSIEREDNANLFHTPKNNANTKVQKVEHMVEQTLLLAEPKDQDEEEISMVMMGQQQEIKIMDIIAHEKAFTCFMSHLASEFSMEILLSIYELVSLKQLISKYLKKHNISYPVLYHTEYDMVVDNDMNKDRKDDNWLDEIQLPETYPDSYIVYHYDELPEAGNEEKQKMDIDILGLQMQEFTTHCKKVVYKLYHKYIAFDSSWEINLSFFIRKKVIEVVDDFDVFMQNEKIGLQELSSIYDECIKGVLNVMTDSYNRFTKTHQYRKLRNLMFLKS